MAFLRVSAPHGGTRNLRWPDDGLPARQSYAGSRCQRRLLAEWRYLPASGSGSALGPPTNFVTPSIGGFREDQSHSAGVLLESAPRALHILPPDPISVASDEPLRRMQLKARA